MKLSDEEMREEFEILDCIKTTLEKYPCVEKFSMGNDRCVYIWGTFDDAKEADIIEHHVKSVHESLSVAFNPDFETGPPWNPGS